MKFFDRLARTPGAKVSTAFQATVDGEVLTMKVPGVAGIGSTLRWGEFAPALAETDGVSVTRPAPEGGVEVEGAPVPLRATKGSTIKQHGAVIVELLGGVAPAPAPEPAKRKRTGAERNGHTEPAAEGVAN